MQAEAGTICLALSRGRILEQALQLFAEAGLRPRANPLRSRRLSI